MPHLRYKVVCANATPLGGPGVIVEIDEAKFGKRKYHRGNYRAGMWVLGGVDRNTNQCFLIPCPNNRRGAEVLLPLIERWVLFFSFSLHSAAASQGLEQREQLYQRVVEWKEEVR